MCMTLLCDCMQVLHLGCELVVMPSFQSVQHLLVEQPDLLPTIRSLYMLPLLESLSLTATDMRNGPLRSVTAHHTLWCFPINPLCRYPPA